MKFEGITEILYCFIFRRALTRHIDLDALGDEPFIFLPNAGSKFLFHNLPLGLPSSPSAFAIITSTCCG
mgnify:CR=1 FL=1